jgi:hypothetical protein
MAWVSGWRLSMERIADAEVTEANVYSARTCAAWGVEMGVCFERKRLRAECPGHVGAGILPAAINRQFSQKHEGMGLIGGFLPPPPDWI